MRVQFNDQNILFTLFRALDPERPESSTYITSITRVLEISV